MPAMRVRGDLRGWSFRAALILLFGPAIALRPPTDSLAVAGLADPARLDGARLGFSFKEVAAEAGLIATTVFGGKEANRYLLETTGTGVALFDYDGDGFLDVFLVNGTTLEGFPKGKEPINHLFRSRGNGTFEDVTARAGVEPAAGARAPARATTTTTATRTSTSRITDRTGCTTIAATGRSRTSPRARDCSTSARGGARAARSSTTTAMAGSTSWPRTTSTSTWPARPRRTAACAATRA